VPRACARKSACRALPLAEPCPRAAAALGVLRDAEHRAGPQALVVRSALLQAVPSVRARPDVAEISMPDQRVSGQSKAAGLREDSRERLAEADSNWVSAEPWEQRPFEPLRPAWRLPAQEKSHAAVGLAF
jgi:hypothetical protein